MISNKELIELAERNPEAFRNLAIQAKALGKIEPSLESLDTVPTQLIDIIRTAIETDKQLRYREALEMGVALEEFVRGESDEPGYTHLQELMKMYWM